MRLVVKIGSSSLTYENGRPNLRHIEALCKTIADVQNAGNEVILVSSGAIAMGVGKMRLPARPSDIAGKQACAAVGQCELMYTYDKIFSEYHYTLAQILLTADDFSSNDRHQKFKDTMAKLLSFGIIPVINENDTVSTDEIKFGDNDSLAALVSCSIGADLLVLFSDIDGLFSADPHKDASAALIPEVREITPAILALGGGAGSSRGTGGMQTKLHAATLVTAAGCDMVIANAQNPALLYDVVEGKPVGTRFFAKKEG